MINIPGRFNTIPNYLSISRFFILIPMAFYLNKIHEAEEYRYYAFGFMMLGFITDLLDGFIARKFNQISEWGKIIDPLADKISVAVVVVSLYRVGEINDFYFGLVILRDVFIFLGGIYVSRKINKVLPSNLLGKIAVFSVGLYLIGVILNVKELPVLYSVLYYSSVFLSFASLAGYGFRGIESIRWYKRNGTI